MLNVNNLINLNNFKTNYRPQVKYAQNIIKFSGENLRPLAQDTINFTGMVETRTAIDNHKTCVELHNEAEKTKKYLESSLQKHFKNLIYDKDTNPQGVIEPIKARVKSADSIEEKIADKIDKAIRAPKIKESIFSPYDKKEICGRQHIKNRKYCRFFCKICVQRLKNA